MANAIAPIVLYAAVWDGLQVLAANFRENGALKRNEVFDEREKVPLITVRVREDLSDACNPKIMRSVAESGGSEGFIGDAAFVIDRLGPLGDQVSVTLGEVIDGACLVFPLRGIVFGDDDRHFHFLFRDGKSLSKKRKFPTAYSWVYTAEGVAVGGRFAVLRGQATLLP